MRIFERQSLGSQADHALRPRDDAVWIVPLSDVVEVLAHLPHRQVGRHVDDVGLYRRGGVVLDQVDDAHLTPFQQVSNQVWKLERKLVE